jgi:uncharacterized membrane protein
MNTVGAPLDDDDDLNLVLPGRGLSAGAGWEWIAGGWRLFLRAPLMWIIALIIIFVAFIAIGLVPILGAVAVQLLQPVVSAGLVIGAHSLERGGNFELEHLFAGFKRNFGNLVVVGLLFLAGGVLIVLVFVALLAMTVGTAVLGALGAGASDQALAAAGASIVMVLVGLLVMMALLVPLLAAYWFAPALVMMHDMKPVAAMRESFFACFRNFVPFLVYGVVVFVLAIVAAIPFGLGYLVLVPVIFASTYVAYRQIFTYETAAPTVLAPDR